jgi:hypothetical protein
MSKVVIVAIDAFDNPNSKVVQPKYKVLPRDRGRYPNLGPVKKKNIDIRVPPLVPRADERDEANNIYNGKAEHVQLLALTSSVVLSMKPPPEFDDFADNAAPWKSDGAGKTVDAARSRQDGHDSRQKDAAERVAKRKTLKVIWTQRRALKTSLFPDPAGTVYTEHPNAPLDRTRLDIIDRYAGYLPNQKWAGERDIWFPSSVTKDSIKATGDISKMTAIGCTCRDAVFRGAIHARYGCKHILTYNMYAAAGNIEFPAG